MKRLYSILGTAVLGIGGLLIVAEPALAQRGYGSGGYYRRYVPPGYYPVQPFYPRYQYSYPYRVYQPAYPVYQYAPPAPTYSVSTAPVAEVVNVGVYDSYFAPATTHVLPGTTVRWINHGRHRHTVTFEDGSWDSILPQGASYSVNFTQPGTYRYHCRYHTGQGMYGTIVVGDTGSVGSSRPPY